jgi:NitT/TauT family transport system substrate-binding protein
MNRMNHFSVATARWVFAGAASLASCALAAPALGTLTLGGPGAVVSYPLMHMVETQALRAHAQNVEFRLWESHDQLSALLVQKKLDFSAAPTTLPALLASKGQNTRLLSVSVWGLVWLVSTDPKVQRFADLGGEELLSPFQHDLGDVLIDTLLTAQAQDGQPAVRSRSCSPARAGTWCWPSPWPPCCCGATSSRVRPAPCTACRAWKACGPPNSPPSPACPRPA